MSDELTPAERAAIAAFPKHRVKHIPRGISGLEAWVWCDKRNTIVPPDGKRWTPWGFQDKTGRRKTAASVSVDDTIVALRGEGRPYSEIAAAVGLTTLAVKGRVARLRARGRM